MNLENLRAVEHLMLEDSRITISRIAHILFVGHNTIQTILHHLNMNKVNARWVPRILCADMQNVRMICAQALLDLCTLDEDGFFTRLDAEDESCFIIAIPKAQLRRKRGC